MAPTGSRRPRCFRLRFHARCARGSLRIRFIGLGLLKHALTRCVEGARLVGGRALLVRAVDAGAREFWLEHGFLQTMDDPLMLFRSMSDVAASLERASR